MRGWGKHGPPARFWVDEIEQIAGRPITKQDWAAVTAAITPYSNTHHNMNKIKIIVESTATGFSAYTANHSAFTTGSNIDDLKSNMIESLNLLFAGEKKVRQEDLDFFFV